MQNNAQRLNPVEAGAAVGGSYAPKKKKLKNILYTKTFKVEGMHCEHCKNRVEEVVNDIQNLACRVDLKKGELTVAYAEEVEDSRITSAIEKAGYTVTGQKSDSK